jgi:hypothetical protein
MSHKDDQKWYETKNLEEYGHGLFLTWFTHESMKTLRTDNKVT